MGDADQKALNALAKGAGVTFVAALISKGLTYLYRISIARFIGPEAYGQLSIGMMIVGIGGAISVLALNEGLQKYIPEMRVNNQKAKIKGLVLGALQISVPVSLLVTGIIFFGAEFIAIDIFGNSELIPLIKIMSVAPFFASLTDIFLDTTIGYNKIIYKTLTEKILQNATQLLVTLALIFIGLEVTAAAWGWVTGVVLSAVVGFYFMERKVGPIITSKEKAQYQRKEVLKFSSPLLLSGVIGTILGWADTAFLGYYMTDYAVGLYNAALPTAIILLIPHQAIGSLAVSSFSELKERNDKGIQDSIKTSTHWAFSLIFPAFLIMALFSEQILYVLFGPQYTEASLALTILATGNLVSASAGKVGDFLRSAGHSRIIFYNSFATLIANILMNIALIPLLGIIGAAVATATTTIIGNMLLIVEAWRKERVITLSNKMLPVIIASTIPLGLIIAIDVLLFANTPYWFLIPAGAIYFMTYGLLFIKIVGLDAPEEEVVRRLGEKTGYEKEAEKILDILDQI